MVHGLSWLADLVKKYRREITLVAVGLVAVAVIFVALTLLRSHNRGLASRAIGQVTDLSAEVAQKPEKLPELEKLAAKGRTARLATLELAKYWSEKGDWAKAGSYLAGMADGRKDLIHYQSEDLKAQIALGQKDYDKAIAIYRKVVEEKPDVYPLDAARFNLADSTERKGDTAAALDLYKKLQEEFPQSYYGYEASLKVSKLSIKK
jgi:predicted negative regulator of RcsB-dependent stress response